MAEKLRISVAERASQSLSAWSLLTETIVSPPGAKAQAASLYLLAYYLGASLIGSYGGRYWAQDGWNGVAALVGVLLLVALAVAMRLAHVAHTDAR